MDTILVNGIMWNYVLTCLFFGMGWSVHYDTIIHPFGVQIHVYDNLLMYTDYLGLQRGIWEWNYYAVDTVDAVDKWVSEFLFRLYC